MKKKPTIKQPIKYNNHPLFNLTKIVNEEVYYDKKLIGWIPVRRFIKKTQYQEEIIYTEPISKARTKNKNGLKDFPPITKIIKP